MRGTTLVGPQGTILPFSSDVFDLRYFGSQGQQRTAVLSTKLAEIEFIRDEVGEYPILLLDDVMSELDETRRLRFLSTVTGRINTFITTTMSAALKTISLTKPRFTGSKQGSLAPEVT